MEPNKVKIGLLKRRAKRLYEAFQKDYKLSGYDCGYFIASYLRPSLGKKWDRFVRTYEDLRKLDPSCPHLTQESLPH